MQIFVVFGFPGAGKTYISTVFRKYFGFYVYEGDKDMPEDMDKTIRSKSVATEDMRDRFFQNMLKKIKELSKKHPKLIISQTFIRELHRKELLRQFPDACFLLVQTNDQIREQRLRERKEYPLSLEQAREMCKNFDKPKVPYEVINNNEDGEVDIQKQLRSLLGGK